MPTDPVKQYLLEAWKRQGETLPETHLDEIGYGYLEHIIGATDAEKMAVLADDCVSLGYLGVKMADKSQCRNGYAAFWNLLVSMMPCAYSKKDKEWLDGQNDANLPFIALYCLDESGGFKIIARVVATETQQRAKGMDFIDYLNSGQSFGKC